MALTFVDELPYTVPRIRSPWDEIAAELKANPHKWAAVKETRHLSGGAMSACVQALAKRGAHFQVTSRKTGETRTVYARWNPTEEK